MYRRTLGCAGGLLYRVAASIFIFSFFLYLYTHQQNELTKLRFRAPMIAKEIRVIREENKRLQYEIDQFENPQHLMTLARGSEFSHLKQPFIKDILSCNEGRIVELPISETKNLPYTPLKATLAVAP